MVFFMSYLKMGFKERGEGLSGLVLLGLELENRQTNPIVILNLFQDTTGR
jgi:hypothetical protein